LSVQVAPQAAGEVRQREAGPTDGRYIPRHLDKHISGLGKALADELVDIKNRSYSAGAVVAGGVVAMVVGVSS